MTSLGVRAVVRPNPTPTLSPFAGGVGFQVTMKTTLDDEADPPMVVVFTPLEGVASASHRIDKSRHLSDGNSRPPASEPADDSFVDARACQRLKHF